jgi:PAS domain-containing protein
MPARSISPSGRRVVTRTGDAPRNDAGPASLLAKLDVALDNMPGALIYTDDQLNIIFCNRRFREMYPAPAELLQPGRPYPDLLRFLADNGYYGDGDRAGLVAPRIDSLRNPSGRSFEDRTSDGRTYRVLRGRVDAGGVVTVMTDITDQKLAEQATARREAQFHVALDNMPGALVYTDADLNIVFCNDRFREMYPAPPELLQSGSPYPAFLY